MLQFLRRRDGLNRRFRREVRALGHLGLKDPLRGTSAGPASPAEPRLGPGGIQPGFDHRFVQRAALRDVPFVEPFPECHLQLGARQRAVLVDVRRGEQPLAEEEAGAEALCRTRQELAEPGAELLEVQLPGLLRVQLGEPRAGQRRELRLRELLIRVLVALRHHEGRQYRAPGLGRTARSPRGSCLSARPRNGLLRLANRMQGRDRGDAQQADGCPESELARGHHGKTLRIGEMTGLDLSGVTPRRAAWKKQDVRTCPASPGWTWRDSGRPQPHAQRPPLMPVSRRCHPQPDPGSRQRLATNADPVNEFEEAESDR